MKKIPAILTVLLAASAAWADGAIEVTPLARNNTIVRVGGSEPLLLLPVQESVADSKVELMVDGRIERVFFVRLADSNIDYTVPFDLRPYRGRGSILLNVISEADRTRSREASDFVCWSTMELADTFDTANTEKYRPAFHHTPLYGWMNDPNGMFYKDGLWHLYYQWNPYGSKWQNMTWGHASSPDLVNWTEHGAAIEPDGLGTVFSGSSVVDTGNTAGFGAGEVVAIYTSAGFNQLQSLAHSSDNGLTFTKLPSNPIITTEREARDPNMFFNPATGKWNLVLAGALDHEMLFYSSDNLADWTYESSFGQGYGCQNGVWECPDLFRLPVKGTHKQKWVLLCNINPGGPFGGSATQYFIGEFDGRTFTPDTPPTVTKWMDFGKDHYATVSWSNAPDGRRTAIGWMSNWEYANEVPTMQFRSANTLPRDLSLFQGPDHEIYLASEPAPELKAMRGTPRSIGQTDLNRTFVSYDIPELCEIVITLDQGRGEDITLQLANAKGESVDMLFDARNRTFTMDRRRSGLTRFNRHFPAKTTAPTFQKKGHGEVELRLFVDRSSIEAFGKDGMFAMTNLVFPTEPYTSLAVKSSGNTAKIKSLEIYPLTK